MGRKVADVIRRMEAPAEPRASGPTRCPGWPLKRMDAVRMRFLPWAGPSINCRVVTPQPTPRPRRRDVLDGARSAGVVDPSDSAVRAEQVFKPRADRA